MSRRLSFQFSPKMVDDKTSHPFWLKLLCSATSDYCRIVPLSRPAIKYSTCDYTDADFDTEFNETGGDDAPRAPFNLKGLNKFVKKCDLQGPR